MKTLALGVVLLGGCRPCPAVYTYRVLYSPGPAVTSHVLDSLGAEGWRLVTTNGPLVYLERVTP